MFKGTGLIPLFICFAVLSFNPRTAEASSHREAPAIAMDAPADITDVYVFPTSSNRVAIVMNVYPGMLAASGPNWYRLDPNVAYDIHIANGSGNSLVYRFRFKDLNYTNPLAPIAMLPGIQFSGGRYQTNLAQVYQVERYIENRVGAPVSGSQVIASGLSVAPTRVGPATTDYENVNNPTDFNSRSKTDPRFADSRYAQLAAPAIRQVGGRRFFVGPRNDPFFVDLGGVFDGLNIRVPTISGTPVDSLKGLNVFSIVMEILASEIGSSVFGVWATTSRRNLQGQMVQVSRLGNPLANEVLVPVNRKDLFNLVPPAFDEQLFGQFFENPALVNILNDLYSKPNGATAPILEPMNATGRSEVRLAYLSGIPELNQIAGVSGDMIRININQPVGWPNGRSLTDDVVKTALGVLAECRIPLTPSLTIGRYDANTINCNLDDGVPADDVTLGGSGIPQSFPYVGMPHSSYGLRGPIGN